MKIINNNIIYEFDKQKQLECAVRLFAESCGKTTNKLTKVKKYKDWAEKTNNNNNK